MVELTLPTLDAPRVEGCGRTNCTVEWSSSFVKRRDDQVPLGFNLSYAPVATNVSDVRSHGRASPIGDGSPGSRGGWKKASGPVEASHPRVRRHEGTEGVGFRRSPPAFSSQDLCR